MNKLTGKNIHYTLQWSEVLMAGTVGVLRKVLHMRRDGGKQCHTDKPDKWWREVEGCCAELVVAKLLNIYWTGIAVGFDSKECDKLKRFDVGPYQVRSTDLPGGHLLVDENESPDDIFLLVIGESPHFKLVGWLRGREAQLPKYWETERLDYPQFMVPQYVLHELETLPEEEEEEW